MYVCIHFNLPHTQTALCLFQNIQHLFIFMICKPDKFPRNFKMATCAVPKILIHESSFRWGNSEERSVTHHPWGPVLQLLITRRLALLFPGKGAHQSDSPTRNANQHPCLWLEIPSCDSRKQNVLLTPIFTSQSFFSMIVK